ncbi:unnamed protein product, partial [Durusdinium trenchii]
SRDGQRALINEQNRLCQPKARLSSEEITCIMLLDALTQPEKSSGTLWQQRTSP